MNAKEATLMTDAVLKAGLITPGQLEEFKRWNTNLDPDAVVEEPKSLEEAAQLVANVLESEGFSLMRSTDLDIIQQYIATATAGLLHFEVDDDQTADVDVTFGKTPTNEYIIAWRSDSMSELLTNGRSFLRVGAENIFFRDVRELFFGSQKVFMICIPSEVTRVG